MLCFSHCFGSPVDYSEWMCITQASVDIPRKWAKVTQNRDGQHMSTSTQPGKGEENGQGRWLQAHQGQLKEPLKSKVLW